MAFNFWSRLLPQAIAVVLCAVTPPLSNGCDFSLGSWILDGSSYPLYDATRDCPFIVQGFDCLRNGRPDHEYLKYKWKPSSCDLVRFDGLKFLERYRGKKIVFVGDSISNNMWQSLTCLLHIAVPQSTYTLRRPTRHLHVFSFPEYEASIVWLKNGYLVDAIHPRGQGRILRLDSITSGNMWRGDVLIFNTYHWWVRGGGPFQTYFQLGNQIIKDMDLMEAYKIGLTTWANWIDSNIDPLMTTVLFQGIAPAHSEGKSCLGQTKPEQGPKPAYPGVDIVRSVLRNMKTPVYLLDITFPSQLRIDGHPSVYTGRGNTFEDCSHWCLAGVPDTWNEILYSVLIGN